MKAFRFQLQRVLDIRKLEEEQVSMRLAGVRQVLKQLENSKKETRETRENILDEWKKAQEGALYVEELIQYQSSIKEKNRKIEVFEGDIQKTLENIREVQLELMEASKKTRVLEKLKEKKKLLYRKEVEEEEQKVLDDIGQQGFQRKKREA